MRALHAGFLDETVCRKYLGFWGREVFDKNGCAVYLGRGTKDR